MMMLHIMVGFFCMAVVAMPSATAASPATTSVSWNASVPLPHVSASPWLASCTADFHAPESTCKGAATPQKCWANASILNVDLDDPGLRAAAVHLAPAIWRIGGSPQDQTVYAMGGNISSCPPSAAPALRALCGARITEDEDKCKKCVKEHAADPTLASFPAAQLDTACKTNGDDAFYCLTSTRWAAVLKFAADAGLKVVFGLNYLGWLNTSDPTSQWDATNAEALLRFTRQSLPVASAAALHGFELGNEINIGPRDGNTTRVALAFARLRRTIARVWDDGDGTAALPTPKVLGPDSSFAHDYSNAYLGAFVRACGVGPPNAVTVHHYPAGKLGGAASLLTDPAFYAATAANLSAMAAATRAAAAAGGAVAPGPPLWWGEGAFDYHSGHDGVTNRFGDALFVAAQLGSLGALSVGAWMRSTLFGGFYELLDHANGFRPHPSWWVMVLFKRLVSGSSSDSGVPVFATHSSSPYVLAFAFGGLAVQNGSHDDFTGTAGSLLMVNLHKTSTSTVTLAHEGAVVGPRSEWCLTAATSAGVALGAGDALSANSVLLNDGTRPLELGADGALPPLPPRVSTPGSMASLPPLSITFMTW